MGFLSKDLSQPKEVKLVSHTANNNPERGAPFMDEISSYFSRGQQISAHQKGFTDAQQQEAHRTHRSPSLVTCQTPSVSTTVLQPERRHIQTSTGLVTDGMCTMTRMPRPSMATGSTSYFTWSGSRPSRRGVPSLCLSRSGLAPSSYSISSPKPANAQFNTRASETAAVAKRVPGTESVLPAEANSCHSSSGSPRPQGEGKDVRSHEGEQVSYFATPHQSTRYIEDGSRNTEVQSRKTVATQTTPGLLLRAGETTTNGMGAFHCTETDSSKRLCPEPNAKDSVDTRNVIEVWQSCPPPEEKHGHIPYGIDKLIDSVSADASMLSPMTFSRLPTWTAPSHGLIRRPLYPRTNGESPSSRKNDHAQFAVTFRNSSHLKHVQQSALLPFRMPGLKRDSSPKAPTVSQTERNLRTSPQRRLSSLTYVEGSCAGFGGTPQSPASHGYPFESIGIPRLPTEQLLECAEPTSLRRQIESTSSTGGESLPPENFTFWRPNKLY